MKKPYERALTTDELTALPDDELDCSDIPELDASFWEKAEVRMPNKTGIYIKLDTDVLEWMKSQGKGYQPRINAVLRSYYEAQHRSNS